MTTAAEGGLETVPADRFRGAHPPPLSRYALLSLPAFGARGARWSANLTLRLLPLVRDSGTILRGRRIGLDDAALTTGYSDTVDLIAQHRSPSYSKTVWGLLQGSEKESLQAGRYEVLNPVS